MTSRPATAEEPNHQGLEAKVAALIAPSLDGMGYELVRVLILGRDRPTVQIMADRADGSQISVEVSSAGIDRPLTRAKDWARFAGHQARAEMTMPVDGRRRFTGIILGADATHARMRLDDGDEVVLPLADLRRAKLLLTDALIAATAPAPPSDTPLLN